MKFTKNYFKYSLLIIGLTSSILSFAEPVTWKLSFADQTGKEVGTGQFTYDPETSKDIKVTNTSDPSLSGETIDSPAQVGITNGIDSISVNLLGETYKDELSRISFDWILEDGPSLRVLENGWWDNTTGSLIMGIGIDGFKVSVSVIEQWTLWGPGSVEDTGMHPNDPSYVEEDKMLDFSLTELMNSGSITGSWGLYTLETWVDYEAEVYPLNANSRYYFDDLHVFEDEENSGTVTATRVMENHSCDSALYTPNKGEISINTLDINGKPYNIVLKKTGGYDFTITKISRDHSDRACQQAQYISNKGIIDIPMLDINGKNYKVMMKKKSGYDFVIKQISRIK